MKRLLLIFALSLPCFAQIAVDGNSNSGTVESATATSHTWNHTVTSNTNGALLVGIDIVDSNALTAGSTVTADGVSMSLTKRCLSVSNNAFATEVWQLIAPHTGTISIVVTLNQAPAQTTRAGAVSFTGVDQTTPVEVSACKDGGSGQPGGPITPLTANAWIMDTVVDGNNDTIVATAPQVEKWNINDPSPNRREGASVQGPIVTPASTAEAWTGFTGAWSQTLAAIKPASAAGATGATVLGTAQIIGAATVK